MQAYDTWSGVFATGTSTRPLAGRQSQVAATIPVPVATMRSSVADEYPATGSVHPDSPLPCSTSPAQTPRQYRGRIIIGRTLYQHKTGSLFQPFQHCAALMKSRRMLAALR